MRSAQTNNNPAANPTNGLNSGGPAKDRGGSREIKVKDVLSQKEALK